MPYRDQYTHMSWTARSASASRLPSGVVDRSRTVGWGRTGFEHAMVMGEYGFTVPLWTQ